MGDRAEQPRIDAALVGMRAATASDEPFLFELYGTTRDEERRVAQWEPAAWEAFLRQQFRAQRDHARLRYPAALEQIVCRQDGEGDAIGRLYVDRAGEAIHVIDIALLPQQRGRGIGTALIGALQREAGAQGRAVTLFVSVMNPAARRFYDRLAFAPIDQGGVYTLLAWRAPSAGDARAD